MTIATRNQTPGEIMTERARIASEGSCKTCQYCGPLPEPVRGYVAQCALQGKANAILFTSEDLERKAFPYICDCGWFDLHHSIICQAYVALRLSRREESRRSLEAHEERMAKGKIAAIAAPGSHPLARQRTEVPGVES